MGLSLQGIARQRPAKTTSKFRGRKDEMSVAEIVSDLKAERIRIEKAISALQGISTDGAGISTQHNRASGRTRRRGHMSPEGQKTNL